MKFELFYMIIKTGGILCHLSRSRRRKKKFSYLINYSTSDHSIRLPACVPLVLSLAQTAKKENLKKQNSQFLLFLPFFLLIDDESIDKERTGA